MVGSSTSPLHSVKFSGRNSLERSLEKSRTKLYSVLLLRVNLYFCLRFLMNLTVFSILLFSEIFMGGTYMWLLDCVQNSEQNSERWIFNNSFSKLRSVMDYAFIVCVLLFWEDSSWPYKFMGNLDTTSIWVLFM